MKPTPVSESPAADDREQLVLLIGNVDHEGIASLLKSSGAEYKKKLLESSPSNWTSILGHFYGYSIRAVIIKLSAYTYELLALEQYRDVAHELFEKISTTRHAVFVFEDLLSRRAESDDIESKSGDENQENQNLGDEEDLSHYGGRFGLRQPATKVLDEVNTMLRAHDLNLIPYRTNAEVTVMASLLLKEALEGLLFRIYVPRGRLWANEVDRLIQLFRDYLLRTGRKGVRLDEIRTDHGTSYEFHGEDASVTGSLAEDFQDFSRFLDLCLSNLPEAEKLLKEKTVNPKEITDILTRYSKEAKRLQLDLRHERQRKILDIQQRLESELTEIAPRETNWRLIESFVASAIPEAYSVASLGATDHMYGRFLPNACSAQLTVNIEPQIVQTVNGIVAREIRGDLNISEESERLHELIAEHAAANTAELTAALQSLSDTGIPKSSRLTSGQKLKGFVFSVAGKIGPAAAKLLTDYIEMKLGLK